MEGGVSDTLREGGVPVDPVCVGVVVEIVSSLIRTSSSGGSTECGQKLNNSSYQL